VSDVLSISVPIGARYASVNHTNAGSHRGGKKSPEYKALFADVKRAAMDAMVLTGWTIARCECFVTIVRYVPDHRQHDAMNLGKCEFDALTAAGIWQDDKWANPCMPWIRYSAPHRVTIVVVKLYESVLSGEMHNPDSPRARRGSARAGNNMSQNLRDKTNHAANGPESVSGGVAYLNGKPISREAALKLAGVK
jgi:Holliday junction resolvase RusA-like endonuclease